MTRIALVVLSVLIASSTFVNAQIPGRLRDKAEGLVGKPERAGDSKVAQPGGASASRPGPNRDKDRQFPPGLSYSTVLNGLQMFARNGRFSLHHIQATFLPDDCDEGFIVLRTKDGQELFQFDWKKDPLRKPYALLNLRRTTDLTTGENIAGQIDFARPGDYVLDFYLPTEHYYTFPFSVVKFGSGDPFGAGECYSLNGDWQKWGYLYYREAKPDQNLAWKVWLRNEGCERKSVKIRVEIRRDADGRLICTSREGTSHRLQPKWDRYDFDLVFSEGQAAPRGTYFKAQDLLQTDGEYTLTMQIDDEPYGTWKFTIKDNQLQYAGRAVRGQADPLTFIEGGRDAWWYEMEK